jgi:hypothetical protein
VAGLVLGIKALSGPQRRVAVAGIVLSSLGLAAMLVLAYMWIDALRHLGVTGLLDGLRDF